MHIYELVAVAAATTSWSYIFCEALKKRRSASLSRALTIAHKRAEPENNYGIVYLDKHGKEVGK